MLAKVKAMKRGIIRRLKKMIKPLLWNCQWGKVFHFETAGMRTRAFNGYNSVEFEGFTDTGLFLDSFGGGAVTESFHSMPLEDLIAVEKLVLKSMPQLKRGARKVKKGVKSG
jgi:hypothetical protein